MFATPKRSPRTWSFYQQRPAPDTGTYFEASWLKTYEQSEKTGFPYGMEHGDLNIYGASDYAVTEGRENYTVHIIVGFDHNSDIYVLTFGVGRRHLTSGLKRFVT